MTDAEALAAIPVELVEGPATVPAVRESFAPAVVDERRASLSDKLAYAEALAAADILPPAYRRKPSNVLIAIEYAEMLGIAPVMALTHIAVVEGKPSMSAEMMRSKVLEAGHRFDILEHSSERARVRITRSDGRSEPLTVQFAIEDARRAQLLSKNNWKHYPASMLLARATSMAVRAVCPDATMGIGYVPEELGAEVDGEGNVVRIPSTHTPDDRPSSADPDELPITTAHLEELEELTKDFSDEMRTTLRSWRTTEGISIKSGEFTVGGWKRLIAKARDLWIENTAANMGEARQVAQDAADAAPGPLAAAPHRAMERTAAGIEEAARPPEPPPDDPVGLVEETFGPTDEVISPEHFENLQKVATSLGEERINEVKAWCREQGIDMRPSQLTVANYTRVMERVAQLVSTTRPRGQAVGAPAATRVPTTLTDNDELAYRGLLQARVADMGASYEEAFQETLDGVDGNPVRGMPWRQQLDRLPLDWHDWLTTQVEDLESAWAVETAGQDEGPSDAEEGPDGPRF